MSRLFKAFIAVALFATLCSGLEAGERPHFIVAQQSVEFIQDDSRHLLISATCRKGPEPAALHCDAYAVLKTISFNPIRTYLKGGKNPGSVICRRELKARVVMGSDGKGNQISFCEFADGSLIDNGTLFYYARDNDTHTK